MVDKFKILAEQIKRDRGSVYVFAMLKMDELTEKWSIILSADWIDETSRKESFDYLFKAVKNLNLTSAEEISIARLGIFPANDHLVQELAKYKVGVITNERVNGNIIHEGYILATGDAN